MDEKMVKRAKLKREKVIRFVFDNPFCEQKDIIESTNYSKRLMKNIINDLIEMGAIIVDYNRRHKDRHKRGKVAYYYVDPKYAIINNIV